MADEKEKSTRKRAAAAAVAVAASASVVTGTLFADPADLLQNDVATPIVETIDDGGSGDDGTNPDETENEESEAAALGLRERMRQWILALPIGVRLVFVLPFWALGYGITAAATALWSAVLSPLLSSALSWVLLIAALVGAFAFTAKAIFPDMPWKKILNRRSILIIILGGLLLGAADHLLPLVWTGYGRFAAIVRMAGSFLVLGGVTTAFALRTHKRRMKARMDAEPELDEAEEALRPMTREDILAMADSVSR